MYLGLFFFQSQQQEGIVGLLLEYLPSMVITASNFVVPFLCDQIARLEKYSPSVTVIFALLRLDTHINTHRDNTESCSNIVLFSFVMKSKLKNIANLLMILC